MAATMTCPPLDLACASAMRLLALLLWSSFERISVDKIRQLIPTTYSSPTYIVFLRVMGRGYRRGKTLLQTTAPQPEPEAETQAAPQPELEAETQAALQPELEAQAKAAPEPEPEREPEPEPEPEAEAETGAASASQLEPEEEQVLAQDESESARRIIEQKDARLSNALFVVAVACGISLAYLMMLVIATP